MRKNLLILIFLSLFALQGCTKNEVSSDGRKSSSNQILGTAANTNEKNTLNTTDQPTQLKLETGKITPLDLNKRYLLSGGEKSYLVKIIPHLSEQYPILEFNIDGSPNDFENDFDVVNSALCYMGPDEIYRIMVCGELGNAHYLIGNYKLTELGVAKESAIPGKIKEIEGDGAVRVESRQFLAGFEMLTTTYKISDDGQMLQDGDYEISSDGANNGSSRFTLVKDIKANLHDQASDTYIKTDIPAGEGLTLYKTNLKDKLCFKMDNGAEGYIEIAFISTNKGFSADGTSLADYFDKSELSWAG